MRKCKIIHINDGRPENISNDDYYYEEGFPRVEACIDRYLAEGYEVKAVIPDVTPNILSEGCYTFFKGGMTFYLEKEE